MGPVESQHALLRNALVLVIRSGRDPDLIRNVQSQMTKSDPSLEKDRARVEKSPGQNLEPATKNARSRATRNALGQSLDRKIKNDRDRKARNPDLDPNVATQWCV